MEQIAYTRDSASELPTPALKPASPHSNHGSIPVTELSPILIASPHPDDETLGCGGLIARCARLACPVTVLALTNGEASHPADTTWREQLGETRKREQRNALKALGLTDPDIIPLALPDGGLDQLDEKQYERLHDLILGVIQSRGIRTLFVPAVDDCHADHRLTARLLAKVASCHPVEHFFSYQIWPPEVRPASVEQANLVIFAGTRRNIVSQEPEARRVWDELIRLIDEYDLYGDVAFPKHHEFGHVPAIYQWAARRHGVFVNPALNEPFGLTLLEAAAAGLPVVATQEGGPVDIVRRCQHGLLGPPTDIQAIAKACTRLLATDMDGTLLGDRDGLTQLKSWLDQNRQCLFVIATGRSVQDALTELETWDAPRPDVLIADVGSSVYQFDDHGKPQLMKDWHHHLKADWQRARCQRLLDAHTALARQPGQTQSSYKPSYFIREARLEKVDLTALRGLRNIYWAGTESAAGIMEGLHYSTRVIKIEAGA